MSIASINVASISPRPPDHAGGTTIFHAYIAEVHKKTLEQFEAGYGYPAEYIPIIASGISKEGALSIAETLWIEKHGSPRRDYRLEIVLVVELVPRERTDGK